MYGYYSFLAKSQFHRCNRIPEEAQVISEAERYLTTNRDCQKGIERHVNWLVPSLPPTALLNPEMILYRFPVAENLPPEEMIHPVHSPMHASPSNRL